jgi:hypothetical protein
VSDCILAIDPGPTESAYVMYEGGSVTEFDKLPNWAIIDAVLQKFGDTPTMLVIEQIAAMGMAVGAEVFETVFWSGRFAQEWENQSGTWDRIKRHEVKMHLCGNMRAKDANIRTALLDKFGPGKEKAVGTKKNPGPLYGVSGDVWAALAVAITYAETRQSSKITGAGGVTPASLNTPKL